MWAKPQVALKEWAVLCALLQAGRHSVLLRKGGAREPKLRVEHRAFWLLPTYFHAREPGRERDLSAEARGRLPEVLAAAPAEGEVRVEVYAEVEAAYEVRERERVHALAGMHGLSAGQVDERFDYREPGLWVLVLRAYRKGQASEFRELREHAGCVSWVHLGEELEEELGGEVEAVLADEEHAARAAGVSAALGAG